MVKTFLDSGELMMELRSHDFVLSTQRQIIKDFQTSGVSFEANFELEPHNYHEIIGVVEQRIADVMQYGEANLLQLLYQIDIPQDEFLMLTTDPDFVEKISDLIVRREAYKVFLRKRFSDAY